MKRPGAKSSWLLNEDIAFIYRAYSTLDWPVKITSPSTMSAKGEVFDTGSSRHDQGGRLQVRRLDEAGTVRRCNESGGTDKGLAEFTVKNLKAGFTSAFSILGMDGKANTRTSNPVLVVVPKPSGSAKDVLALTETGRYRPHLLPGRFRTRSRRRSGQQRRGQARPRRQRFHQRQRRDPRQEDRPGRQAHDPDGILEGR